MKTIIAGSRTLARTNMTNGILECPWKITAVVSGCAVGIDSFAIDYASLANLPLFRFPAAWKSQEWKSYDPKRGYDPKAGFRRNELMAQNAEALLAIWDGKSSGTKHMISMAEKYRLKIYIHLVN